MLLRSTKIKGVFELMIYEENGREDLLFFFNYEQYKLSFLKNKLVTKKSYITIYQFFLKIIIYLVVFSILA